MAKAPTKRELEDAIQTLNIALGYGFDCSLHHFVLHNTYEFVIENLDFNEKQTILLPKELVQRWDDA